MPRQTAIQVADSSQIGEARRFAVRRAETAGFNADDTGKVAIIATEMATNLVRHAASGELLIQMIESNGGDSLEILSIDSGPGMANVNQCLQDGYSTSGTAGNGLGAIKRLSSQFDIFSTPAVGTVIVSRVLAQTQVTIPPAPFTIGATSIAVSGETACGDGWQSSQSGSVFRLMVADGLGHGPLAEEAANAALRVFGSQADSEPVPTLQAASRALSGTRGAAVAVARLDTQLGQLKYAGIGNIGGYLVMPAGSQGLVSNNGIVGIQVPKVQQFDYRCAGDGLLIMHSDGIKSRWTLDAYPGLASHHPAIVAGVLYRDYRRGRDDSTVVVVRFGSARV